MTPASGRHGTWSALPDPLFFVAFGVLLRRARRRPCRVFCRRATLVASTTSLVHDLGGGHRAPLPSALSSRDPRRVLWMCSRTLSQPDPLSTTLKPVLADSTTWPVSRAVSRIASRNEGRRCSREMTSLGAAGEGGDAVAPVCGYARPAIASDDAMSCSSSSASSRTPCDTAPTNRCFSRLARRCGPSSWSSWC